MSDAEPGPLAGEFLGYEARGVRDQWSDAAGAPAPGGPMDAFDPGEDVGLSPDAHPLLGDEPSDASPEPH